MLATPSLSMNTHPHGYYQPLTPSPLSPRSPNIYGGSARRRTIGHSMSSPSGPSAHKSAETGNVFCGGNAASSDDASVPFAKRAVKKAPSPKQDELKERRRSMFLKKVRDGRDDKRFEARGEDMMRMDFVQRQRQWEAERAREGRWIPSDLPEEEESDLPMSSNQSGGWAFGSQLPTAQAEVDDLLQREDQELEDLLALMPQDDDNAMGEEPHSDHTWSDDDDYDALFSELMDQSGGNNGVQESGQIATDPMDQDEEMDLS